MIKRGKIEEYFINLEVDEKTIETESGFETVFTVDYFDFSMDCILEIDEYNLRLNMVIDSVDMSYDVLAMVNEFNRNSKYLKANYSFANENILISTCQLYTNSNFEKVLDAILNSIVNLDSEFIENLYHKNLEFMEENIDE